MNKIKAIIIVFACIFCMASASEVTSKDLSAEVHLILSARLNDYIIKGEYKSKYDNKEKASKRCDAIAQYYASFITDDIPSINISKGAEWYVDDIYQWVTAGHEIHFSDKIILDEYFRSRSEYFRKTFCQKIPDDLEVNRISGWYDAEMDKISKHACAFFERYKPELSPIHICPTCVIDKANDLSFYEGQKSMNLSDYLLQYQLDCVKSIAKSEVHNVKRILTSSLHDRDKLLGRVFKNMSLNADEIHDYLKSRLFNRQFKKYMFTGPVKNDILEIVLELERINFSR